MDKSEIEPHQNVFSDEFVNSVKQRLTRIEILQEHSFEIPLEMRKNEMNELFSSLSNDIINSHANPVSSKERAFFMFAKGKFHILQGTQYKKREELLQKSVKLDASNPEAWRTLGYAFWLKGDFTSASKCFDTCLEQDENNINYLCDYSMLLRKMVKDEKEVSDNVAKSLELAKKATSINLNDGYCWFVLGNSYLAKCFMHSHSEIDVNTSLKAYQRAEKCTLRPAINNPDLYLNRGTLYRFREKYQDAIDSFKRALILDSDLLSAHNYLDSSIRFIKKVHKLITTKVNCKPQKISSLILTFSNEEKKERNRSFTNIKSLHDGNNNKVIDLMMMVPLSNSEGPTCFIVMDSKGNFACISIYNVSKDILDLFRVHTILTVFDPLLVNVSVKLDSNSEDKAITFKSIQVNDPDKLKYSQPIDKKYLIHPQLSIRTN